MNIEEGNDTGNEELKFSHIIENKTGNEDSNPIQKLDRNLAHRFISSGYSSPKNSCSALWYTVACGVTIRRYSDTVV